MDGHLLRPAAALLAGLFVIAACTGDDAATPSPEPQPEAGTGEAVSTSQLPACSDSSGAAGDIPGWPLMGSADADFMPVVMSSLVTGGYNRFLYNVYDASYRQLAAPELASRVDFYALERDPDEPAWRTGATYLSSGLGRGLYRTEVEFDCLGEWGAEVFVEGEDGEWLAERLRFAVNPAGGTPAIGAAPPLSDSLTATTAEEVALISTDENPYLPAYDKTVAETVTSGKPSFVFFATPAFCQTGFCGPTVELVKSVAKEHPDDLEFVNVEPYHLQMSENGLQPLLSEDGQLQPVDAALEWGIPVEPYLFLLDADGRVFAKFEGVVGGDELRAAVEDVLAA
ncbi:MAG: hypothetical protein AB1Z67_02845 [Candidatus Limnocylindrales bacterium]